MITNVPKVIVEELQKIQQNFMAKHKTLSNTFEAGGPENVNINLKVISLQCSWLKK